MLVLGIETSCDETAAAVVESGRRMLSNVVCSSLSLHKKYGGVIPEIASRLHIETISFVADAAIEESGIKIKELALIAVTDEPGLPGSLLTGISFANALSFSLGIPLVRVNHLHSHIYANFLNGNRIRFPFISLIVSGGHTSLFLVRDFKHIKTLGVTLDDACGEAYDKVAKILELDYPGGPIIERLARKANDAKKINFRCGEEVRGFNFSFSGIKTAVLYYTRNQPAPAKRSGPGKPDPRYRVGAPRNQKTNISYSFQEAVIDSLIHKSLLACQRKKVKTLVIGGGVASNNRLRERFLAEAGENGINVYFPPKELCMDNAAMVAGMGYWKRKSQSEKRKAGR